MAQYFKQEKGIEVSSKGLSEMADIYDEIGKVNASFARRLANIESEDTNISALINLDGFAQLTSASILDDSLSEIEILFEAYTKYAE